MVHRHRPRGDAAPSPSEPSRVEAGRQIQLVGRRLRRLRKDHRLTVPELAAAAGIQAADLARLEKGEHRVSLDVLFRLLAVLATSVESFFADVTRELAQGGGGEIARES